MASPEWFFSTMAQSVAAIIGFIMAFTAVLYSLERQRREERTDDLRAELIDLRDKYIDILDKIESALFDRLFQDDIKDKIGDKDAQKRKKEIEEIIDEENIKNPDTMFFWWHVNRITNLLDDIEGSSDPMSLLLDLDQMDKLRESIEWITNRLHPTDRDFLKQLYTELGGKKDPKNVISTNILTEKKEGLDPNMSERKATKDLKYWFKQKSTPRIGVTGNDLRSWRYLFNALDSDFDKVDKIKGYTILDFSPNSKKIIMVSGVLTIPGIFLPLLFLLTGIETILSTTMVIYYQIITFVLTTFLVGWLVLMVFNNLKNEYKK